MNYQNSKIYKITDNTTDMIYIGSTCKTLDRRLKQHEAQFKAFKAGKYHFITSFKILDNNDYKIELVENYPCATKQDLNIREGNIIKQLRNEKLNIVNKFVAGQTRAQYRQENINIINEKQKCSCGGKFTYNGKSQHEKTKKHQNYINNSKTINIQTLNLNITLNNPEDLDKILKTINK